MLSEWQIIRDNTALERDRFETSACELERTQSELLLDILTRNAKTTYGRNYAFEEIKSTSDYQEKVPVVDYDDLEHDIDAQSRGENTLCSDSVVFYEKTGGSTSGQKKLPYTPSALQALQRAVDPWLFDLAQNRPAATLGRSYWSISPVGRTSDNTPDGTPVGAPSDLAFLTPTIQQAFANLMSVPAQVSQLQDISEWRYHTLFGLIADENLSLISLWNPSFLTLLIDGLPDLTERLYHDLTCGDSDSTLDVDFSAAIKNRCDTRSMLLRTQSALSNGVIDTSKLWPNLDTISCWTHGSASHTLLALQHQFPNTYIQPKGLLSTEAVVSIPLEGCIAPVLAVNSAFFEFKDHSGAIRFAHQLEIDKTYEVIVTTFGGLYRYALGDMVTVKGFYRELPCLEFIGRHGVLSDLCGEKINDAFVATCLQIVPGFSLLVANPPESPPGYRLLVDADQIDGSSVTSLCEDVEASLQRNPQYAYARHLEQLEPLTVIRILSPEKHYQSFRASQGQLIGDIKPAALCVDLELAHHLGSLVATNERSQLSR